MCVCSDNHVLLQQVAQSLLSQYKSFFSEHPYTGLPSLLGIHSLFLLCG
jgi:hypothetical protein